MSVMLRVGIWNFGFMIAFTTLEFLKLEFKRLKSWAYDSL